MTVIFYAEPLDNAQIPKWVADSESLEARWVTLDEFSGFKKIRGRELLEYGHYNEDGGQISPMSVFENVRDELPDPAKNLAFVIPQKNSTVSS